MKCLVFLPNDCFIEILLPTGALGQECLEKACNILNIIESCFFGLQFKKDGNFYWLFLKKRIDQQTIVRLTTVKFYLKVKFFVLPHFIQQNSTR